MSTTSQAENRDLLGNASHETINNELERMSISEKDEHPIGLDDRARSAKTHQPTREQVLKNLKHWQQQAVSSAQAKAKVMHEKALPRLQKRVASLGFTEQDLTNCLDYIREEAPIIIHLTPTSLSKVVKDTHYRSLFETNTSGGNSCKTTRGGWEKTMFGKCYDGVEPFDRPKYGCLNVSGDVQGVQPARRYGRCFLLLQQHVRLRTTFFCRDTGGFSSSDTLATCEYYAHILQKYNDTELKAAINAASSSSGVGGAASSCENEYKEVQIHGPVCLATDVQALSVPGQEKDASNQLKQDVLEFQKKAKCYALWQGDLLNAEPIRHNATTAAPSIVTPGPTGTTSTPASSSTTPGPTGSTATTPGSTPVGTPELISSTTAAPKAGCCVVA